MKKKRGGPKVPGYQCHLAVSPVPRRAVITKDAYHKFGKKSCPKSEVARKLFRNYAPLSGGGVLWITWFQVASGPLFKKEKKSPVFPFYHSRLPYAKLEKIPRSVGDHFVRWHIVYTDLDLITRMLSGVNVP